MEASWGEGSGRRKEVGAGAQGLFPSPSITSLLFRLASEKARTPGVFPRVGCLTLATEIDGRGRQVHTPQGLEAHLGVLRFQILKSQKKGPPRSFPSLPIQTTPPPGAGPGVTETFLLDPASLARQEGRAGHRKLVSGWVESRGSWRAQLELYWALLEQGEGKKNNNKNQPLCDLEKATLFLPCK